MKNYSILWLLIFGVALFTSCKNDEKIIDYEVDIAIIEPEDAAVFFSGEEFHMEVDFDGTKAIGNYEILALNLTSGDTIVHFTGTSNDLFVAFHDHLDLPILTEVSDCIFTASAWETNYPDKISKSVTFTINP